MQAIDEGRLVGPRIVPAAYALSATGGHCDETFLPPALHRPAPGVADGPQALRDKVREMRRNGAQVIKVCATGGVFSRNTEPGQQQLSEEELRAIAEEAHQWGLRVAAHAHGAAGIRAAIRAGIDTIEHASLIDAEGIRLAREHGTWLVMDIFNTEYTQAHGRENGILEDNLRKDREIAQIQRDNFRAAHRRRRQHGVRHRCRRHAARQRRRPVPLYGRIWNDADGSDPVRHHATPPRRSAARPTSARSRPAASATSSPSMATRSPMSASSRVSKSSSRAASWSATGGTPARVVHPELINRSHRSCFPVGLWPRPGVIGGTLTSREGSPPMKGYVDNIAVATIANQDFRRVLYTAKHLQLVLMTLPPGCDIGEEVHEDRDQFFRFEEGRGRGPDRRRRPSRSRTISQSSSPPAPATT